MNKLYNIRFILVLFGLSACDDFLSQKPDNRTDLNTAEKISELLVSAYPEANYMTFCESMTDNVSERPSAPTDPTNTNPYFWEDVADSEEDSPQLYWNACYAAIAAANHALEAIENSSDPSQYTAQRGEALVARAYAHFMLVNLFAKMYDESTAASDPGIPYVTVPEKVAMKDYQRRTVQYVYEMIGRDLERGIPLINDAIYTVPAYHFTKAAAHAFAVRFYLYQKDYEKVIEHADMAFPDNDFAVRLRPWNSTYETLPYDALEAEYTKATEEANLLLCETSSLWARSYNRLRYTTGPSEQGAVHSVAAIVDGGFSYTVYYTNNDNYFVVKFREHFVRSDISANIGEPYTILPLFTVEEVLLSRAEAYAHEGKLTESLADLNVFLSKRINNYDPGVHTLTAARAMQFFTINPQVAYFTPGNSQEAIIQATLLFRRAEFLHEGLWWFDIIRYDIPVIHATEDGEVFTLQPDDPRRVLQIPSEAISLSGLAPNPR